MKKYVLLLILSLFRLNSSAQIYFPNNFKGVIDTSIVSEHYNNAVEPTWLSIMKHQQQEIHQYETHFLDSLMSLMTLDEKIGQLNLPSVGFDVTGPVLSKDVESKIDKGQVGGVFNTFTPIAVRKLQSRALKNTRLGIPLLLGYDVIHGHRTIFPIPLGLSCSWNPELIQSIASVAAKEATADGLNWTFSPMVDITRDPRWGRVSEGAGEDPYLGGIIAQSMVAGYQGGNLKKHDKLMACVKHFALYGAAEAGRDYNTVDMSEFKMYNEYLPPYNAAIYAGVESVMTSFNDVNGIPVTCNDFLIQDVLRNKWNFDGMVVTDYTAIKELVYHGVGDDKTVAAKAIQAGAEMDMVGEYYLNYLKEIARDNKEYEKYIDRACRNILKAKLRLGLFEDPYRGLDESRQVDIMSEENLSIAQQAAQESFVLLKNFNNTLPLNKSQKIAFIGPQIQRKRDLIGNWSGAGDWKKAVSIWEAVSGLKHVSYAQGCNLLEDENIISKLNAHDGQVPAPVDAKVLLKEAMKVAKKADVIVVALGEAFGMSGEAASMSNIDLPEHQLNLLKELKTLGKPIVLVLFNGRPLVLTEAEKYSDAILECWFPGTQGGYAVSNTLFGKYNPGGKLSMTFPRNMGQIPIYYAQRNTGRPFEEDQKYTSKYLDVSNEPLYPFGYGLSYSTFTIKLESILEEGNFIYLQAQVENTSNIKGSEVVQVYYRDKICSHSRPLKQLCRFVKVELKGGEKRTVQFDISRQELGFFDKNGNWILEKGDFEFFIGSSSQDLQKVDFVLK